MQQQRSHPSIFDKFFATDLTKNFFSAVSSLLADAGVDAHIIDKIVYVGGTMCLPSLGDSICLRGGFGEDIETPFSRGTVVGGNQQRFWLVDVLSGLRLSHLSVTVRLNYERLSLVRLR